MEEINISLVQSTIFWEDTAKNLQHFDQLVSGIQEETDLIVLPEMFTTGFTMQPAKLAEENGGSGLAWMKAKAQEKKCVITGSICVNEDGKYYNRLFWVRPDGSYSQYDKRHLFRMARENEYYTQGSNLITESIKGWKIRPLICYDLRFPIWSRNRWTEEYNADYDVLLYVANWPEVRNYPWKHLLIARAIENQAYVVSVNRIGKDGNGIDHSGDSACINPRGELISTIKSHVETIETIKINPNYLIEFRKQFPVGNDADGFEIKS